MIFRLRHSLAECQINEIYENNDNSAHPNHQHNACSYQQSPTTKPSRFPPTNNISHAPLAPQEEYLDETSSTSASTFYSDLLASSFSSSGHSSSGGFTCDYEDTNDTSFIMSSGLPALSWNVQVSTDSWFGIGTVFLSVEI